ncbi:jg1784 [Pararge aegeria aegeria]|uniref:HECT-type E3 ubiquitin transferase n=1 Tax=Pararge aegeria aegeria TaxID=348720 RepID=A0A8S4RRI2_9NEOP|nr:jg1784 [Pararge aegeria aegeria]
MFSKSITTKDSFLEQTKAAREERALEKKREQSAIQIQAIVRGWLARHRFVKLILDEFDQLLPESVSQGSQDEPQPPELIQALDVYRAACRLFLIFKQQRDKKRFEKLCKYVVQSLHSESVKISYVGVFLNKEYSFRWIAHIKDMLYKCCQYLEELKPESPLDMQSILIHLHTLLAFTATNTWALTRLKNFEKLRGGMTQLCANVMGSLFHRGYYLTLKSLLLRGLCREKVGLKNISLTAIVTLALRPLVSAQFSEKLLTMYIIQILSVPTLVFHMQQISPESIAAFRSHGMFDKCVEFLSADQNMRIVFNTLEGNYALCLLGNLIQLAYCEREHAQPNAYYPTFVLVVSRFLDSCQQYVVCKKGNLSNWHPILGWFAQSFDAYLPPTMGNLRFQLSLLWGTPLLKKLLGSPLKDMLEAGITGEEGAGPSQPSTPVQSNNPAAFIRRAIEARTSRILDDMEMYEKQDPFKLQDFINMSHFLNMFIYKSIIGQLFDLKTIQSNEVFSSLHTLLLALYRRDCRRAYAPVQHWLIREIRDTQFMADLEKGKKPQQVLVQKTPHMIAHGERVRLFRRAVADEKFLEETIKRVFDPSLNLFRVTSEERLYPSPTSCLQENHLQLFEFIGRMLGKAVYEGIVVDVPFASFFLSQVLGQTQQALYSWIDELPSLDRDLYRSLTYIKHFQGDISTLELTFSVDEERLGEIVTHELVPGGKAIPVTNENKINYIHLMAHFRMHTQIKDQTNAFIKGFRTIINPEWLSLFSTPELQRLISGDNVPLDLRDLRRHTQYYGGFHDSHRVVVSYAVFSQSERKTHSIDCQLRRRVSTY